eukprot:TRINITY_DN8882_c0_g1_i1.p1 TRINITY_DN8882_c0_g1~~TRINITY_DN8882_c0_g1_i1.p1  ORF type:complete len:274 (+),score=50.16 TRINITY_DN8882_c0_g1_i1:103-924(+)
MPLVIICGVPSSGKTTVAQQLQAYFKEQQKEVVLVNEESLLINKNEGYQDSKAEKNTRGGLKSTVERNTSRETIVILDSLNYIKGFRYELFCIARALATPHCVVHCDYSPEKTLDWHSNDSSSNKFNDSLFEELALRFERPNPRNRWDKPLFTISETQPLEPSLVFEAIVNNRNAPTPNSATQPHVLSETNYLYQLDQKTKEIVNAVVEAQKVLLIGSVLTFPNATEKLTLRKVLTMAELQRLRRQFLKISNMHPPPVDAIADSFVVYLASLV